MATSKPEIIQAEVVTGASLSPSKATLRLNLVDEGGAPLDMTNQSARLDTVEGDLASLTTRVEALENPA